MSALCKCGHSASDHRCEFVVCDCRAFVDAAPDYRAEHDALLAELRAMREDLDAVHTWEDGIRRTRERIDRLVPLDGAVSPGVPVVSPGAIPGKPAFNPRDAASTFRLRNLLVEVRDVVLPRKQRRAEELVLAWWAIAIRRGGR